MQRVSHSGLTEAKPIDAGGERSDRIADFGQESLPFGELVQNGRHQCRFGVIIALESPAVEYYAEGVSVPGSLAQVLLEHEDDA